MACFKPTLALLGLALSQSACYATASGRADVDYVEVETVPAHVEVYPSYYYSGRTVYLVDGRWYYRRGPRWVYYREEPPELHRQRRYVEQAPRAPDRREVRRRHARPADHRHRDHDHDRD
jgi:hypothetical protein